MQLVAQVNVPEAKSHFLRLLAEVEAGGKVIIARAGKPVTKLVRTDPAPGGHRRLGALAGQATELLAIFGNWTEADQAQLETDFYDGPIFPPNP